jgi:predicted amidohydrolase
MFLRFLIILAFLTLLPHPARAQLKRPVTVGAYQGPCQDGDFAANLAAARSIVAQALERKCDFLVFPETFLSGYDTADHVNQGARPLQDPELQAFIKESVGHDMVIVVGLARRMEDTLRNTALVIHQGRLLGTYDKVMLTSGDRESLGFKPGTSVPVFHAHGLRFAVAICHDTSFPHIATAARLQGARLLFTPHYNSLAPQAVDNHRRWVRNCHVGLACQLKMVVARANVVGPVRANAVSYGDSFILSPQGEPLAEADLFRTELITARISPEVFSAPTVWADLDETPAWLRQQVGTMLTEFRKPDSDEDLRRWLENMVRYHRYTLNEVSAATGLTRAEARAAVNRFRLDSAQPVPPQADEPLRVLPYPGGRHPRIGFLEGAIMPQRDTKFSVFSPWAPTHYVVVDLPEAIWSNLGLTYLAHTHIPTIWTKEDIALPRSEWEAQVDGTLSSQRILPNGIAFGAEVIPTPTEIRMRLWLRNGTPELLSDLRVQNCVHLKGAPDFNAQSLSNKLFQPPFAAVRSAQPNRWIITAWTPIDRCWGNEGVPCVHADPKFPDCAPGQTVELRGWLSFFDGQNIDTEFKRILQTGYLNAEGEP